VLIRRLSIIMMIAPKIKRSTQSMRTFHLMVKFKTIAHAF